MDLYSWVPKHIMTKLCFPLRLRICKVPLPNPPKHSCLHTQNLLYCLILRKNNSLKQNNAQNRSNRALLSFLKGGKRNNRSPDVCTRLSSTHVSIESIEQKATCPAKLEPNLTLSNVPSTYDITPLLNNKFT